MSDQVSNKAVEVRNVSKSFGVVRALDEVSLDVHAGEIHGIVGQNGAGKSTLMQILSGVFPPDAGEIAFGGRTVHMRSPNDARLLGVRTIYQELNLVPYQTIAENIFLGIEPRNRFGLLGRGRMRARSRELLARLGNDLAVDLRVDQLSIGQQQLVEIAKALAWQAQLLILDEPTAALELADVEHLFDVLVRFREHGGTALYVSHRLNELFRICDRVTVVRDGRIVATLPIGETSRAEIVRLMIGRPLTEVFPDRRAEPSVDDMLEARGLTSSMLRDVSFTARRGTILGVAGLEGSGIRELGRVLVGDQQLDAGRLVLEGRPLRLHRPSEAVRAGVAYLSSDRKRDGLFAILPVAQNITIGSLGDIQRAGVLDARAERRRVGDSVAQLGIRIASAAQEARYLSGGNQQKVLLARWLAARPRVYVLDEPTRGIDVGSKAEIYAIMRRLADDGAAVVMISTDLTEVLGMSDELIVLHGGELVAHLPGGLQESDVLPYVLGVAA